MKLVLESTGEELKIGQSVTTFRGETMALESFREPHKEGSSGRVYCRRLGDKYANEYFPSVIGARFI